MKFGKGGDTHRAGMQGGKDRGKVNPPTDQERIEGQEERGEIDTSTEAVRKVAAEMDKTGGTGVLGRKRDKK